MKNKVIKDKTFLNDSKEFLKKNFDGYSCTYWHNYFSIARGTKELEFIPEDLYWLQLEPVLSKNDFAPALSDKISYDNIFPKASMPSTIFKIINGRFFDPENNFIVRKEALKRLGMLNCRLILKPSTESGGGKNIIVDLAKNLGKRLETENYFKDSFIIQEWIKQHKITEQFHPNSLNTCRLMTARVDSEIVILSAFFRTGSKNSVVDNGQAGGVMCYINEDGKLAKTAINKKAEPFEKHPDSGIKFEGIEIPNYKQVKEFCINNHKRFLRFTFISWDMAIREDGSIVFIEFNPRNQGINNHQILNGPLFGRHTAYFAKRLNEEKDKVNPPKFIV